MLLHTACPCRTAALFAVLLVAVAQWQAVPPTVSATPILPNGPGAWLGSAFEVHTEAVETYRKRVGISPAIFNIFVPLPLGENGTSYLRLAIPQFTAIKAGIMITATPLDGLAAVTEGAIDELAFFISQAEQGGSAVLVRYAHEMNGNWYPWGQAPLEYVASWRLVTNLLRSKTCNPQMVWAPNVAWGYPWRKGNEVRGHGAAEGTTDFDAMDTNGNGNTDSLDDPFEPYYPGDEYVDWVGTSIDHFGGVVSPYHKNLLPGNREFTNKLTGAGLKGPGNLYKRYSADKVHKKPLVVAETAAMYLPSVVDGSSELEIKSAWWKQAFNVHGDRKDALDLATHYPLIKAIIWFDEKKPEATAADKIVDWQFSNNPDVLKGFVDWVTTPTNSSDAKDIPYWKLLEDFVQQGDGKRCSESPPRFAFQSPPPQAPLIPQNPVLPNGLPSGYSTGASGASATNIIALVQGR